MPPKLNRSRLTEPVRGTDHVRGSARPRVTLVGYGDFANPECLKTYRAVNRVQKKMGRTVRYVFRAFPASEGGESSQRAAEAAECAGAQGKFWEMHDRMFDHPGALGEFRLARHAASIGLDVRRFQHEMVESRARSPGQDGRRRRASKRCERHPRSVHQLGPISKLFRPRDPSRVRPGGGRPLRRGDSADSLGSDIRGQTPAGSDPSTMTDGRPSGGCLIATAPSGSDPSTIASGRPSGGCLIAR